MFSRGGSFSVLLVFVSLVKTSHAAEDITINECLYSWNITSQLFSCFVAWTGDPPNNYYDLSVLYNGAFSIFKRRINDVTMHNFTIKPTIDSGSADVQISNFASVSCTLNFVVPDPDPIEAIHVLNYTIINTTNEMQTPPDNTIPVFVSDLHINWSVPVSPTGNINNLTYEIRLADNETIPDSATVLPLSDITTSIDQQYQTGSVSMSNIIQVPETFTMLYFQIRSMYNITLGRNNDLTEYTMISDWSSSQPLLRFPPAVSSTTTLLPGSSSTTTLPGPASSTMSIDITGSSTPSSHISTASSLSPMLTTYYKSSNTIIMMTSTRSSSFITTTSSLPPPSSIITMYITGKGSVVFSTSSTVTETNNATNIIATKPTDDSLTYIIVGVVIAGVLVVLIIITIIIIICALLRNKKRKAIPVHHEDMTLENIRVVNSDKWEIPHECVIYDEGIGSGAFGEVYKAILKGHSSKMMDMYLQRNNHNYSVAVKTLKSDAMETDQEQFLKEIELMKRISSNSNPHVVNMIGASTASPPLLLVLEYVQHGDLLAYLKSCRHESLRGSAILPLSAGLDPLEASDVASFAYQIASGMEYLSSMGLVHRDLAARNILMGEGRKLKITDFGLSRQLNLEMMYVAQPGGRFPVRWMAIESIMDRKFTKNSDVWSFGVTLWEIGSLGETPFSTVGNDDLLRHIKNGHRLQRPADYINDEIYSLMKKCWAVRPSDRPSFTQLRKSFDVMLSRNRVGDDFYLDLNRSLRRGSLSPNNANSLSRPNTYVKVS